jgi:hypothetical protein
MKQFSTFVITLAMLTLLSGPARAVVYLTVKPSGLTANACYTPADAEAERALRIRSELMVIGLNCQASRFSGTTENLYNVYRQFVANHGPQFANYERQMLDYFIRSGSTDPETSLSELSAGFGNKLSLYVTQMRPDMFCYQYSKRLLTVKTMTSETFQQWAATSDASYPPTQAMCQAAQP